MIHPLDATPMQLREELAIVWSIVEQEKEFSSRLKKALAEREKQVLLLREPAKFLCNDMRGTQAESDFALPMFLLEEALAATKDLSGLVLCEAKPVAWKDANDGILFHSHDLPTDIPLYRAAKEQGK